MGMRAEEAQAALRSMTSARCLPVHLETGIAKSDEAYRLAGKIILVTSLKGDGNLRGDSTEAERVRPDAA